jgi:nitrilase
MRASALPVGLGSASVSTPYLLIERGGSAIIAPDGRYLAGPVFEDEAVLTATLDLSEIEKESMTLDVSGHYSRPDIFEFNVAVPRKRP